MNRILAVFSLISFLIFSCNSVQNQSSTSQSSHPDTIPKNSLLPNPGRSIPDPSQSGEKHLLMEKPSLGSLRIFEDSFSKYNYVLDTTVFISGIPLLDTTYRLMALIGKPDQTRIDTNEEGDGELFYVFRYDSMEYRYWKKGIIDFRTYDKRFILFNKIKPGDGIDLIKNYFSKSYRNRDIDDNKDEWVSMYTCYYKNGHIVPSDFSIYFIIRKDHVRSFTFNLNFS